jgi:hypothetical protein
MGYKIYVNIHYLCIFIECGIPGLRVAPATKFCTVVPIICGFPGDATCITVTRLAPGILRKQREFLVKHASVYFDRFRELELYFDIKVVNCQGRVLSGTNRIVLC